MKKALTIVTLAAVLVGTVACSSKNKKAEEQAATTTETVTTTETMADTETSPSLGAGSSGYGH